MKNQSAYNGLTAEIKQKSARIAELEAEVKELKSMLFIKECALKDAEEELDDWEDHECECDCEEEVQEALWGTTNRIPYETIEDQRKVNLLSSNWHSISYDHLYDLLNSSLANMLPPRL